MIQFAPSPRPTGRWALVVGSVVAVPLLAVAAWLVVVAKVRPPDYAEGCLMFNAARIRDGLPLYIDPTVGAWEYGPVPSRYFVAYTPIYAALLSQAPAASALTLGRLAGVALWAASLLLPLRAARPPCRLPAAAVSAFLGGTYLFAWTAAGARPDPLALLLASVAFARSLQRGRVGRFDAALFVLATFVKPSVLGLGVGTLLVDAVQRRGRAVAPVTAAAATAILLGGGLLFLSGGRAFAHLIPAVALLFDPQLLVANLSLRLPFFGPLIVGAGALAWSHRRDASGRLALGGIVVSTLTVVAGIGKVGSGSNYWMEPCLAALVIVAHMPLPGLPHAATRLAAACAAVAFAWVGVATVRSVREELVRVPRQAAALRPLRDACAVGSGGVALSDNPGTEFALNDRILIHPLEFYGEVRRGHFDESVWVADVARPEVRCVVTAVADDRGPAPHPVGAFPPRVAAALEARFRLAEVRSGWALYLEREASPSSR